MTEIEWTDAEREVIADVIASQYLHLRDGRSVQIATAILAKWAPHVAAREAQARAEGATQALNDARRDCPLDDVVQILDFLEARHQEAARMTESPA
jgi:hypothetical protein